MTLLLVDVRAISLFELLLNGAVETLVYRFLDLVCASTSLCYFLRNGMGRPCRHPVSVLGAFKLFFMASEPSHVLHQRLQEFSLSPHTCCFDAMVVLFVFSLSHSVQCEVAFPGG